MPHMPSVVACILEIVADHLNVKGVVLLKTADLYATAKTIAAVFYHVLRVDTQAYIASGVCRRRASPDS